MVSMNILRRSITFHTVLVEAYLSASARWIVSKACRVTRSSPCST